MRQLASPSSNRDGGRQRRAQAARPSAIVAEAVVNAGRWICNVIAGFSPGPDFVLIGISGKLPEQRIRPQGWRGRLQRRLSPPQESLQVWRERLQLLAEDPRVKG